jgi:hypothetical protein
MATVNKDFKIKSGLIVEGTTATVNGYDILTKSQAGQDYIIDLIGGSATSANTPDTVVLRDGSGNFAAGTITADLTGQVSDISNHNTDNLSEGLTNKYFTSQRAQDALSGMYDPAGTAATEAGYVASDLSDHVSDTSAHGVTGNVVGTSDTQTLTNKTIGDTLNFTGAGAMTINSDSHIVLTPASGSSVKWGSDVLATQTYADQAQTDAEAYADSLAGNYDASGAAATALQDAKDYTDTAVSDLVDSAPDLLNTLGELATALQENPDIISDLQDIAAGKQDTLTPGSNIDITGATISVTGLDSADISDFNTAALSATSAAYDAAGAAATAQSNAEDYADGLAINYDAAGSATSAAATALQDAKDYADALDTDDVAEGTAQYFTDARAKSSAADLLTGASLTNITITGTGAGLTITAENGVADSDTDDLTEGTTNLYFTDARAYDAVNGTEIGFTAVNIDSVAKQVAATVSCPVAGINQAYGFDPEVYRSAEFLVKVAYGSHTEISKVLLTLDTSDNIAITEYGIVGTNGSASSISADISGGNVRLLATTVNNNSTVTVMGTLLK